MWWLRKGISPPFLKGRHLTQQTPLKKFFFNYSIITLQTCVGFRHASTWIDHRYTYVSSLFNPPRLPPHPIPLGCTSFGFPLLYTKLSLLIYFTYGNIYVSMLFSQIIPSFPSPTVSKNPFFMSVSPRSQTPFSQVQRVESKLEASSLYNKEVFSHHTWWLNYARGKRTILAQHGKICFCNHNIKG